MSYEIFVSKANYFSHQNCLVKLKISYFWILETAVRGGGKLHAF